ncbi:MAG: MFS transporter [Treponema sp.]|jgi:GPH family glycoside/pentoside/hexuronide:cation symporter|nr:MFS transporter [Treponema sp.]
MAKLAQQSVPQVQTNKMPAWYVLAWNSRALSVAIGTVVLMQLTYYSTEVAGLGAALVGTLFLASKILDGFTDLIAGFIIDKTNTRLGKGRPYELFIIPMWVFIVFLFSTPDMGETGKIVYIFVFYALINSVCTTFLNAAETVFMGRAIDSDEGRGKIMAIGGVIIMLVSAVSSMILPQLMKSWGAEPGGWTKIALVYAIPMMAIGMVRFIVIKEKKPDGGTVTGGKIAFVDNMKLVVKNKYLFIFILLVLLSNLTTYMISITGSYYFRFVIGNLGMMSMIGMMGLLGPFLFLLFPVALRKMGSIGFVRIGFIVAAIASAIRFFFPDNMPILMVSNMLGGVGITSITMINHFFLLQCVEYGELKTGKRIEGTPAAMNGFAGKLGSALASGGVGFIMAAFGYVSTGATQPESALLSIRLLYSIIPAIVCAIMLIILHFFDVEKVLKTMRKEKVA